MTPRLANAGTLTPTLSSVKPLMKLRLFVLKGNIGIMKPWPEVQSHIAHIDRISGTRNLDVKVEVNGEK